MILYIRSVDWESENQFFEVDYNETNRKLTLNLYLKNDSDVELVCTKEINLQSIFKSKNFFTLRIKSVAGKTGFGELIDLNNISRSRDELCAQQLIDNTNDYPNVVIYFHNSADEVLVFINSSVKTQYSYQLIDNKPAYLIAQNIYPDLVNVSNIWGARKDMIWQLDPNQSLAYIEAQLDAVTKVLFLMLEQLPDVKAKLIQKFPELADLESELNNTSVFNVKAAADCLMEITKTKTKVRQLQTAYYAVKRQNGAQ